MKSVLVVSQSFVLEDALEIESLEMDVHAPEKTELDVIVDNVSFMSDLDSGLRLKLCALSGVTVTRGALPEVIPNIVLGESLTWSGPENVALQARLKLSMNGHTKIIAAEPVHTPIFVSREVKIARRNQINLALAQRLAELLG